MVRANLRYRNTLNQPMEICLHLQLLSDNLKRMKDGGELMFWKNNYSKVKPNAAPKRGRGRPAKTKDHLQARPVDPAMHRGRPIKDSNAPSILANVVMSYVSKKPRGRPRKLAQSNAGVGLFMTTLMTTTTKGRQRGRLPKVKPPLTKTISRIETLLSLVSRMIEALFEDLTLSDTNEEENKENVQEEDQEDENHVHMEKDKPESNLCEKNMKEKIDYIVQTLECLQNYVETLNTKIESLTKENDELSKELEAALATIKAVC
ncbi:hypothetical protein FNV43_RR02420 [Rhamnella rubrinervis]|uniref:Uncharacterized protein n=1 Tax=Rhamnella rubrinervis TaxID=2594499 RepID=A0A8K0MSY9_9ROSA|nr:hypothetical protein FNV43_RR02420 [Rhamnella rubrinervis]